jgi:hypothetical protein
VAVLGIDPGSDTAGALILACRPDPILFELREPTAAQIYRAVRWAKAEAETAGEALELVTEDQYVARGKKANAQSTLSVARSAERWLTIAELLGVRSTQAHPSTWRSPMIKSVPASDGSLKERTQIYAARLWPEVEVRRGEPATTDGEVLETASLKTDPIDALVMAKWRAMQLSSKAPRKRRAT